MEEKRQDKSGLSELADELRAELSHLQSRDIDDKVADADEKFSHLVDALSDR